MLASNQFIKQVLAEFCERFMGDALGEVRFEHSDPEDTPTQDAEVAKVHERSAALSFASSALPPNFGIFWKVRPYLPSLLVPLTLLDCTIARAGR